MEQAGPAWPVKWKSDGEGEGRLVVGVLQAAQV